VDRLSLITRARSLAERTVGPHVAETITGRVYQRGFFGAREWRNLALGVFSSFDEAAAYCRSHHAVPHYELYVDHRQWLQRQMALRAHDYPVLYWLMRLVSSAPSVVDVGGSVGVSYYAFSRFLPNADQYRWQVLELADVVKTGREIAEQHACRSLSFTERWEDLTAADVLLCAGAAQFLPVDLSDHLQSLSERERPRNVIVNRVPIHATRSYVTLHNTGASITPCKVYARDQFVGAFAALGLSLIDEWICPENELVIPYHPELTVPTFRGFCFGHT
jgi:putative methyltransferase (TIGR04325 family)